MKLLAKEYMCGMMEENIQGNGKTIKCTELVSSIGTMEENILANIVKIKSMVLGFLNGQMGKNIKKSKYNKIFKNINIEDVMKVNG